MAEVQIEERELLYALEGARKPLSLKVAADVTVVQFLEQVRGLTGRGDLEEVLIEDEEIALGDQVLIVERIFVEEFKLVHVATRGKIAVTVTFNGKAKEHPFGPNATMEKIVRWAMTAFELEGVPSDFQLKHGDDLLPPGLHLGQVAEGRKAVRLALVMKIKPQG